MNEKQKQDQEQLGHDQPPHRVAQDNEGLSLAVEPNPNATQMAPWSGLRRQLEISSVPTQVKPLMADPTEEVTPTQVKPLISEPMNDATVPTEVKPLIADSIAPLQQRPRINVGRRALLIGGVTAVAVAGGALAVTFMRQTFQSSSPAVSVHFTPGRPVLHLTGHTSPITNVVWSPDGHYLVSTTNDPFAMLWNVAPFLQRSSSSLQTIDRPTRQWSPEKDGLNSNQVYWTPDGRYLLTAVADGTALDPIPALLDPFARSSKPRTFNDRSIKHPFFRSAVMNPQGSTVAAIDGTLRRYHKIALWQLHTLTEPYASLTYADASQFIGDSSAMGVIDWSCDGEQLAGLTDHSEVVIWNTNSRTIHTVVKLPERVKDARFANVFRIALFWSPRNPHLLAVSNFDTIAIIDVQQKKVLYQLSTDDKNALDATKDPEDPSIIYPQVLGITWSPDGRYLAGSYVRSPKVFVWDLQAKDARMKKGLTIQSALFPRGDSTGQTDTINDLSWSPDGRYLATASDDQSLAIWQVES